MTRRAKVDLEGLATAYEKKFGAESLVEAAESPSRVTHWLKTGVIAFDILLGSHGIPMGRVTEIYGPFSTGKTLLLYKLFYNIQRDGGMGFLADSERSLSPELAKACGLQLSEDKAVDRGQHALRHLQCDYLEQFFVKIRWLLKYLESRDYDIDEHGPVLIGLDSIASLPTKKEFESEEYIADMGLRAKILAQELKTIIGRLSDMNVCFIIINQVRSKIGGWGGDPEMSSGGHAKEHTISLQLKLKRGAKIKHPKGAWPIGQYGHFIVEKSRFTPPFRRCKFRIPFGQPIARYSGLIDLAIDLNVVEKTKKGSSWLVFKETKFQRKTFVDKVGKTKEFKKALQEKVNGYIDTAL